MQYFLWALFALVIAGPVAAAPGDPVGPEFQVNTYTTGSQRNVAVGRDGGDGFVVVWASYVYSQGTGTALSSVQGQRFSSTGTPVGPEFQVNTYTTGYRDEPSVAPVDDGGFVVVWASKGGSGTDTDRFSVQGQRFASTGEPLGPEFQVNTYTTGYQSSPAVGPDGSGGFVVVWTSDGSSGTDTDDSSVQGQRFASTGEPVGSEFQVNTYTTRYQLQSEVGPDGSGGFVVVWSSEGSSGTDTEVRSIQGQRFASTGEPLGPEFQVNAYTTGIQSRPAVGPDGSGGFVAVWLGVGGVRGQRFGSTGEVVGPEFQVNTYPGVLPYAWPAVGPAGSGFVVVWTSEGSSGTDTDDWSVQGQRFASTGEPLGPEFQVNTYTTSAQGYPSVGPDGGGGFVVAWTSVGGRGTDADNSVQAQRFEGSIPILAGDGRGRPERDCYIGLGGYTEADLVPINKKGTKRGIRCTDCDPTCDLGGVGVPSNLCRFRVAACVNLDTPACDPTTRQPRKLRARATWRRAPGRRTIDLTNVPNGLTHACGTLTNFDVPVRGRRHTKPGKGKVILKATKPPDRDTFVFVCDPRPPGEACPTTTTTTTTTTSTTIQAPGPCTGGESGPFCDLGDGTVFDRSTGLQWEQKDTAVGSGMDVGNLHDVDNVYSWAGYCGARNDKWCQPNLAAETACKAETNAAYWEYGCEQCSVGEGTCVANYHFPETTTVWDWISQVNAEGGTGFAGHADWRLASESACNICAVCTEMGPPCHCTACDAHELEMILLAPESILGPTDTQGGYWSATSLEPDPSIAWASLETDYFPGPHVWAFSKPATLHVRAVR